MTNSQLAKAWAVIGLFALLFSLDSWLRTQGLSPMFGSKLPQPDQRSAAALFGFIVTAILIGTLLKVANVYTQRLSPSNLASRLPVAFYETLDTSQPEAITYQRLMFFAFHVVPLVAMAHFLHIVLSDSYVVKAACELGNMTPISLWTWPDPYVLNDGYRLACCDGVTFFPVLEPVLLISVAFLLLVFSLRYWLLLRVRPTLIDSDKSESEECNNERQ